MVTGISSPLFKSTFDQEIAPKEKQLIDQLRKHPDQISELLVREREVLMSPDATPAPSIPRLCIETIATQTSDPLIIRAHTIAMELNTMQRPEELDLKTKRRVFAEMVRFNVLFDYSLGSIIASSAIAETERLQRGQFIAEYARAINEMSTRIGMNLAPSERRDFLEHLKVNAQDAVRLLDLDSTGVKLYDEQVRAVQRTPGLGQPVPNQKYPAPSVIMAGAQFSRRYYGLLYPLASQLPPVQSPPKSQ